jgi:two-component system LytT family sensor kinase
MRRVYSRADVGKLFLLFTASGLLEFWYRYLDFVARHQSINWLFPFIEQMTGNYASLALLFVVVTPVALGMRPDQHRWTRWVPVHAAAVVVYSLIHTTLLWGSRVAIFPLLGLGAYDYGVMPVRYLMELPTDVISYVVNAGAVVFVWRSREASAREIQMAQLRAELAQAQLESLTLQLQPHFLFNALNAVAATIYEDARKADMMLSRLADYLRRTLKTTSAQQVPLAQELEMLDLYLSMMKARFEDDLRLDLDIGEGLGEALVPQLILQPIVENAIHHGFDPVSSTVHVELSVSRVDGDLVLIVRDHGRGFAAAATPRIGLTNTQSRLARLHGDRARVEIVNAAGGGTAVTIRLPFLTAAAMSQSQLSPLSQQPLPPQPLKQQPLAQPTHPS